MGESEPQDKLQHIHQHSNYARSVHLMRTPQAPLAANQQGPRHPLTKGPTITGDWGPATDTRPASLGGKGGGGGWGWEGGCVKIAAEGQEHACVGREGDRANV